MAWHRKTVRLPEYTLYHDEKIMTDSFYITEAQADDLPQLCAAAADFDITYDADYWRQSLHAAKDGATRQFFIARDMADGAIVGTAQLVFQPRQRVFRTLGAAVIEDVNVTRARRGTGIARTLLGHVETAAGIRGVACIGLAVGVQAKFGPAQRLYGSCGYIPLGDGLHEDQLLVDSDMVLRLSDDCVLHFLKNIAQ